jgi:RNA polymerase sigma-70 factor (ECF subfamily)
MSGVFPEEGSPPPSSPPGIFLAPHGSGSRGSNGKGLGMSEAVAEETLIARAAAGDAQAMQGLLRMHRRRLEAYVRERLPRPLRTVIEPRDILQDVYQLAFRGIASFVPDGPDASFRWFVTIARNHMTRLLRAHQTEKRGGRLVRDEDVEGLLEQLVISHRTPSKSAIRRELAVALERALDQLPANYNQALRLRYFEGLGFEQIAARMNRSQGSAQMLCNRGLKRLKGALASASRYA